MNNLFDTAVFDVHLIVIRSRLALTSIVPKKGADLNPEL